MEDWCHFMDGCSPNGCTMRTPENAHIRNFLWQKANGSVQKNGMKSRAKNTLHQRPKCGNTSRSTHKRTKPGLEMCQKSPKKCGLWMNTSLFRMMRKPKCRGELGGRALSAELPSSWQLVQYWDCWLAKLEQVGRRC